VNVSATEQIGTITDLNPSTKYNCSVHAVTKFHGRKSQFIRVKTAKKGSYIRTYTTIDRENFGVKKIL